MDYITALENYKRYLKSNLTKKNTESMLINVIKNFFILLGINEIEEITSDSFINYKEIQIKRGVGGKSINNYISLLKTFFEYLEEHQNKKDISKYCTPIPYKRAKTLRGVKQYKEEHEEIGKVIPKEHFKKIKQCSLDSDFTGANWLMIQIGLICGLRNCEIVSLKVNNFDFEKGTITVFSENSKNGKWRTFRVGNNYFLDRIKKYISENEIRTNEFLFPSLVCKGKHITTTAFASNFKKIFSEAGLPVGRANDGYTTHDLRRTNATLLITAKPPLPIYEISKRLGHSSITMTERYLKEFINEENNEMIDRVVKNAIRI